MHIHSFLCPLNRLQLCIFIILLYSVYLYIIANSLLLLLLLFETVPTFDVI